MTSPTSTLVLVNNSDVWSRFIFQRLHRLFLTVDLKKAEPLAMKDSLAEEVILKKFVRGQAFQVS
jgi:hypothetical protein